jgi:hypothetical protein
MDEKDRKLALRQAKGRTQVQYIKELLRGPVEIVGWWIQSESDIGYDSRQNVDRRLLDRGFTFENFNSKSGKKYLTLIPPKKNNK